uniref:Uncharacterized protein n=1 Tax=Nelumbo nucifera TaxID=4432 RepID=A0A822YZW8_NELNU|nr:TPA_asm: hypothetical protein HUJ06_005398 [Nelumbo nucifera]
MRQVRAGDEFPITLVECHPVVSSLGLCRIVRHGPSRRRINREQNPSNIGAMELIRHPLISRSSMLSARLVLSLVLTHLGLEPLCALRRVGTQVGLDGSIDLATLKAIFGELVD